MGQPPPYPPTDPRLEGHRRALDALEVLEAELARMMFPDPQRGSVSALDPHRRTVETIRATIRQHAVFTNRRPQEDV